MSLYIALMFHSEQKYIYEITTKDTNKRISARSLEVQEFSQVQDVICSSKEMQIKHKIFDGVYLKLVLWWYSFACL